MKTETETDIYSDLAIPPGEYLEEAVRESRITKTELAKRMNCSASKLNAVLKGKKAITSEMALQLEKILSVPAHIWIGLESEYRMTLARQKTSEKTAYHDIRTQLNAPAF